MSVPVSYHLGKFPPADLDWRPLIPLIGKANAALARYDGLLSAIPNASVPLSPLTTQEAVLSSKIEGTNVTMGEVLELEAGGEPADFTQPKRDDAEEVLNYRIALNICAKSLAERPLSQHLLREAHAVLMRGVRGQDKTPGQYRVDQNWIGPKGCPIEEAGFVPIAPEHLQAGMDAWMAYLNDETQPDPLVQLAIVHLEFEALHPFCDGNGRLGRMLIPLYLYQRRLLDSPNFYMSGYLEAHREAYQERLRAVSRDGFWTAWCAFSWRASSSRRRRTSARPAPFSLSTTGRRRAWSRSHTPSMHCERWTSCFSSRSSPRRTSPRRRESPNRRRRESWRCYARQICSTPCARAEAGGPASMLSARC